MDLRAETRYAFGVSYELDPILPDLAVLPPELQRLLGQEEMPRLLRLFVDRTIEAVEDVDIEWPEHDHYEQLRRFSQRTSPADLARVLDEAREAASIVVLLRAIPGFLSQGQAEVGSGLGDYPFFDWAVEFATAVRPRFGGIARNLDHPAAAARYELLRWCSALSLLVSNEGLPAALGRRVAELWRGVAGEVEAELSRLVPAMSARLRDPDVEVAACAVQAIAQIEAADDDRVRQLLREYEGDRDPRDLVHGRFDFLVRDSPILRLLPPQG